jgi:hypothetical protein
LGPSRQLRSEKNPEKEQITGLQRIHDRPNKPTADFETAFNKLTSGDITITKGQY